MPNHWVGFSGSDPLMRLEQVRDIIDGSDATLVTDQIYFSDDDTTAYALIKIPDGFDATEVLHELGGTRGNAWAA